MKTLAFILVIILAFLQYELWFSKNGVQQYIALKQAIRLQQQQNAELSQQNQKLVIEINNLRHGHEAIEEHARNDLGMIKSGETFYQVVPAPQAH
jgi:cell division protein FtsB